MYMARQNVFQIENVGKLAEKGSPPLKYFFISIALSYKCLLRCRRVRNLQGPKKTRDRQIQGDRQTKTE